MLRGLGAHIRGANGENQAIIRFLKVANDTAIAVNQGGKRKGAVCAYLETWRVDIENSSQEYRLGAFEPAVGAVALTTSEPRQS
ncbi:hypothetical protein J4G43_040805 [Bradyrhizobium barranii subsp. barranii]|uniref:Ribonucleotide reductase large subunit C-terminal domain-containing protein n=1 Tax=Bradyrhizobium barranii subsp. barranii TaxID=2823807 RepID=A0A9X9YCR3_9BRAD|nr:hypothetical protein J4G43_040805 [Bradyrhizobium barranii subsp. barranii]